VTQTSPPIPLDHKVAAMARLGAVFIRRIFLGRRSRGRTLTRSGWLYGGLSLFMGIAATNTQANLLFAVFGLMLGIFLATGVLSSNVIRKLSITRVLPSQLICGQTASLVYECTNAKRFWPAMSIRIMETAGGHMFVRKPLAYLQHLAAKAGTTITIDITPRRRGVLELDGIELSTGYPLGFARRIKRLSQRESMVVFPALGRVDDRLLAMCRSADASGATVRPRGGGQDEFYGIHEFRTGQNPRWIYWRRSARTGVLVSREMTQVSPPRIVVLIDTQQGADPDEASAVERTIAMAASLADAALERGMSVGMAAPHAGAGEDWLLVPPTRGKRHRLDLLTAMARLPRNADQPAERLIEVARDMTAGGATAILMTPRRLEMHLADRVRGAMLVVQTSSPADAAWFHFDPSIDFASMPS
jgi:uncharacterized protein (DUF58 family)